MTQFELVVVILIPVTGLALAYHCCLRYRDAKKQEQRSVIVTAHDKLFWVGDRGARYPVLRDLTMEERREMRLMACV